MHLKILVLSYIELEKEGRLLRAYNTLRNQHEIFLIDVSSKRSISSSRVSIQLKSKNNLIKNIEFCIKAVYHARKTEFDVIYAHNYFTALSGIIISAFYRKKMVYDAYELYYPKSKEKFTLRDWMFYVFEKAAIKKAKEVSCASEERALIMTGHYKLSKIPMVIKNTSDYKGSCEQRTLLKDEKIKIVYAGYLSQDRFLIETLEKIKISDIRDKIQFDIYGNGPLFDELYRLDKEKNYSFFNFKGIYNNKDLNGILKKYHIGYLAYPNTDYNNIFCSPNKLLDYVSNGLVVISPFNYTLDKEINKNQIGVCDDNIIFAIKTIINDYEAFSHNLSYHLSKNLWENEKEKLFELFEHGRR